MSTLRLTKRGETVRAALRGIIIGVVMFVVFFIALAINAWLIKVGFNHGVVPIVERSKGTIGTMGFPEALAIAIAGTAFRNFQSNRRSDKNG